MSGRAHVLTCIIMRQRIGLGSLVFNNCFPCSTLQWGAADAEIKVPSGENTELKRFLFKAWSRSVHSRTCYAYCQGFLSYFYTSLSIHLHFVQNLSRFFPVLAVANTWFLCRPAE